MKIIHVDMDCFFAAVEMREHPEYKSKPLAVGGAADKRGVISTCNYEARRFGIRSAMPTATALRLCPQLRVVRGDMALYKSISGQIHKIFSRYTDKIESLSLDEAWLDVSESQQCRGSATLIAEQIRTDIYKTTGLTASAGVAPNKYLAKIASDINKPNGLFIITPEQVEGFVKTLPLSKIPGVGKATRNRLLELGLGTAEDVQKLALEDMVRHFGKFGKVLFERCHGIDHRQVVTERVRKSVGVEKTLADDLRTEEQCWDVMEILYPEFCSRIERAMCAGRIAKLGVKLKFSDFRQTTVEIRGSGYSLISFRPLLSEAFSRSAGKSVRLVGLNVGLNTQLSSQLAFLF